MNDELKRKLEAEDWQGWLEEQKELQKKLVKHRRFLVEAEYLESFERRNEAVPPWLMLETRITRDGVVGYMVPCKSDDPDAEKVL